ncbi:MAG: permease [Chloroflexi bacterium]|nr:permease [Chloroflexota bacterium]
MITLTRSNYRFFGLLLLGLALSILAVRDVPVVVWETVPDRFQTFVTIFLGIFIEAVPFLLAGSLVSGLVEVFLDHERLARFIPRRPALAVTAGALLGMTFPVCECGVVPVARRLYQKGLPLPVGIAFIMAAPVVNPVVIISTYAAFGWGPIFVGRIVFSFLIAAAIGLLFYRARPQEVVLPVPHLDIVEVSAEHFDPNPPLGSRLLAAFNFAGDDFIDMGRYLVMGSMIAAGMQTLVPQSVLLNIGKGPVVSVVALLLLAFVLSICSTVDAFLALSFVNTFTAGSILGFLVFGPMVDVKSTLMFLGVFRRRSVAYLVLLPFVLAMLMAVYINLNLGW